MFFRSYGTLICFEGKKSTIIHCSTIRFEKIKGYLPKCMYNRITKYNRKLRVGRKKNPKKNTTIIRILEYFNTQSEYLQIMPSTKTNIQTNQ